MAVGLAVVALIGGAGLLCVRIAPTGTAARGLAHLLPLPQVHAAMADQALAQAPVDLQAAQRHTRQELDLAPRHTEAWLREAFIEAQLSSGRLSPEANAALGQAYALAPFDAKFASWRLRFILERWDSADPSIRTYAMNEIGVLWHETTFRRATRPLLLSLVNPAGQMALNLRVQALERARSSRSPTP